MRRICTLVVLALGIAFNGGAANSAAEVTCPETPVPSEGSATEQDQLALLSDQATACLGKESLHGRLLYSAKSSGARRPTLPPISIAAAPRHRPAKWRLP